MHASFLQIVRWLWPFMQLLPYTWLPSLQVCWPIGVAFDLAGTRSGCLSPADIELARGHSELERLILAVAFASFPSPACETLTTVHAGMPWQGPQTSQNLKTPAIGRSVDLDRPDELYFPGTQRYMLGGALVMAAKASSRVVHHARRLA